MMSDYFGDSIQLELFYPIGTTLQTKKMQKDPGKYIFVENCSFHNSILAPFFYM